MSPDLIKAIGLLRRALRRAAVAALAGSGVGTRQLVVLRELRQAGPLSQVELARSTATDPAGMMRSIDSLEARGWVRRASSATDRRCKLVSLTPLGEQALVRLDVSYDALRALADRALTSAERRQFSALAGRLAAAFDAAEGSLSSAPTPTRPRAGSRRPEDR